MKRWWIRIALAPLLAVFLTLAISTAALAVPEDFLPLRLGEATWPSEYQYPQISGDRIVWSRSDGSDYEIFTWTPEDGTVQLTNNADYYDVDPQVSGDRIVWQGWDNGGRHIFTWTPSGGTVQINSGGAYWPEYPQVSGDRIVWQGWNGADRQIFTWTPAGGVVQLTSNPGTNWRPQVSGDRVVWEGSGGEYTEIFTWTPSGGTAQISSVPYYSNNPQVSGDRVVWEGFDTLDYEIFTWTPAGGEVQLTSNATGDSHPRVSGNRVVWTSNVAAPFFSQVFTWTPAGGVVQLSSTSLGNDFPAVSGDRVIWQGYDGAHNEIFTWTPGDGTDRVTSAGTTYATHESPLVSDDRVVWRQWDGGYGPDAWQIVTASDNAQITGAVAGNDGGTVPLVGAHVTVSLDPADPHYDGGNPTNNLVGTTTTTTGGDYSLNVSTFRGSGLPLGSIVRVTASMDGYLSVTQVGAFDGSRLICDFEGFNLLVGAPWEDRRLPKDTGQGTPAPYSHLLPDYLGSRPVITSLSQTSGPTGGAASLIVHGTGFNGVSGPAGVTFGDVNASSYTVDSDTQITAVTLPHVRGVVLVEVSAFGGPAFYVAGSEYTFIPPTITSLNPNSGPLSGGTSVVIAGTGFEAVTGPSGVTFGETDATSYTVDSDTQITAVAPAHAAGTVGVQVRDAADANTDTAADWYTYMGAPAIASLDPSTGPTDGGITVTISGYNLDGATSVTFGGAEATTYTVNYPTNITVTAPAHDPGTVDVVVTTPGGTSSPEGTENDFTYYPVVPDVSSLLPNQGPVGGGTTVVITGTEFAEATSVAFGGTEAATFTVDSDTQITATSPAHVPGTVQVKVTNANGESADVAADDFTYVPAAGIPESFSPTRVTTNAFYDDYPEVSGDRIVWSGVPDGTDYEVYTWTPSGGTVRLTTNSRDDHLPVVSGDRIAWDAPGGSDGGSDYEIFTWTPSGGIVQITRNSLDDGYVNISGDRIVWMEAQTASYENYEIFTWTPGSSVQRITNNSYEDLFPNVSGNRIAWVNDSAPLGKALTWTPSGGTVQVYSGEREIDYATVSQDRVACVSAPDGSPDGIYTWTPTSSEWILTGEIGLDLQISGDRIIWDALVGETYQIFTWTPSEGTTQLSSGAADQLLERVSGDRVVWVDEGPPGVASKVFCWTPSRGAVQVTSDSADAWSSVVSGDRLAWIQYVGPGSNWEVYTAVAFLAVPPTISALTPNQGSTNGGTTVTITGTNFAGLSGASAVTFGGVAAKSYSVDSPTQITAVAPTHAAGTVRVQVTTPGGTTTDTSADDFAYITPNHYEETDGHLVYAGSWVPYASASAWAGAYARANTNGSSVAIYFTGTQLDWIGMKGTTAGKADVYLDDAFVKTVDLAATSAVYKQVLWSTPTLDGGRHKVSISWYASNVAGKYINLDAVEVLGTLAYGPPTITSLSPTAGSTDGGTSITITGTGFAGLSGASAVTFGDLDAASYSVDSPTRITAVAPAHAEGSVRVKVTTPSGSTPDTAADDYTYIEIAVPTIGSLSPTSGTTAGGTSVVITGSGFVGVSGASAVTFGGVAAKSYMVNSPTQITAVSPAHAAGAVRVQVTALGGATADTGADDFTYVAPPVKYQQTSTALVYSGTWSTISTASASGSSYKRSYTAGASVIIPFNGTRLDWIATRSTSQGKADIYVDDVLVTDPLAPLDLYRSPTAYQQTVWSTGTLPAGYHTVKIVRSTKSAAGKYINLDAALIYGTVTANTRFEQTSSLLVWAPSYATWTTGTTSYASGGSYKYINKTGSVTINFTGLSLDIVAKKAPSYGVMKVTLDNDPAKVFYVNLYRSATAYKQTVWKSGWLTPGDHTVTIEWTGTKGVSTGGATINLDAVLVRGVLR